MAVRKKASEEVAPQTEVRPVADSPVADSAVPAPSVTPEENRGQQKQINPSEAIANLRESVSSGFGKAFSEIAYMVVRLEMQIETLSAANKRMAEHIDAMNNAGVPMGVATAAPATNRAARRKK